MAARRLSIEEFKGRDSWAEEYATIDVREEGVFARGHLLFATPLSLSRLELNIRALVPRRATRIILMDEGDGELASRAADVLERGGYSNVETLSGGIAGCAAGGLELFTGVNVPSKAFGEMVEHVCRTPHIDPRELRARIDRGDDIVVLDSRPFDEYRMMNIPGATSCPSQELLYRLPAVVAGDRSTIVVNCAGRTRSIIGAQSLINAGVSNPVLALENGTMGWKLAGFQWEEGQTRRAAKGPAAAVPAARRRAARIARRAGVREIDWQTYRAWCAEADRRTLYTFDIRPADEYAQGHIAGAVAVEGVQLVQKTDNHVAVWNARIVVSDDDGVRALMTAAWLAQMGLKDVAVLAHRDAAADLMLGPYRPEPLIPLPRVPSISPADLNKLLQDRQATVVDVSRSIAYKAGHIPGAWFAIRARLKNSLSRIALADSVVFTSEDSAIAAFAASDVATHLSRRILMLDGGNKAWIAAGLPIERGLSSLADQPEDAFWRPYELDAAPSSEMAKYLSWEQGLLEQIERDGSARFRPLTPAEIAADSGV
jgi:rhodanese-related sulfurtransferase